MTTDGSPSEIRDVVLGKSSKVWSALSQIEALSLRVKHSTSHRDLEAFEFLPTDRVWILSYSRVARENEAIFRRLSAAGVHEVIYVSSSSTIVNDLTSCYEYPRVKQLAELAVLEMAQARILTIGMTYDAESELPRGENIATSYKELAAFMLAPDWNGSEKRRKRLFRIVSRPFASSLESQLFRFYGRLIQYAGSHPCLLRPLDLALRTLNCRWYGYVYLSNRLWISTMS
jgi:hypothetical protein